MKIGEAKPNSAFQTVSYQANERHSLVIVPSISYPPAFPESKLASKIARYRIDKI